MCRIINHHKSRLTNELFSSIEEGRAESLDRFIQFDFKSEMPPLICEPVTAEIKLEFPSFFLLHKCITNMAPYYSGPDIEAPEDVRILVSKKVKIAEKLIKMSDPALDVNCVDDSGLSVLHKSIMLGDIDFATFIIDVITDTTTDKKFSLNLNSRCHKKGWAPIHYAVDRGFIPAIRLLAKYGANLQASSATDKRINPMELAKQKVKAAQSNPALKAHAEAVVACLNELITIQKITAKDNKKSEANNSAGSSNNRSNKDDAKNVSNSLKPLSSDKSSTKSSNTSASTGAPPITSTTTSTPIEPQADAKSSLDKKKKKTENKKSGTVVDSKTTSKQDSSGSTLKTSKEKSSSTKSNTIMTSMGEMSIVSRDELVDRLLSMGFREADCLTAITLYGTDIDQAISWLCDRPNPTSSIDNKSSGRVLSREGSMKGNTTESNAAASTNVTSSQPQQTTSAPKTVSKESSLASTIDQTAELQMKKEEMRRINRAWNAKTEDEKRKVRLVHALHDLMPLKLISHSLL